MINHKNTKLLQRKMFLIRALENKNITQAQYDAEVPDIEKQVAINTDEFLKEHYANLKDTTVEIKRTIISDGNFKRSIAKMLIKFLEENQLPGDDIKGVMRQGYKICRSKV